MTHTLSRPQKLSWVTIPLLVQGILSIIGGVLLLIAGPTIMSSMMGTGDAEADMIAGFSSGMFVVIGIISIAFGVFYILVQRAVAAGKSWGRIAAIVLGILSLFSFPIGTILGILILIGAFDKDVEAYCRS